MTLKVSDLPPIFLNKQEELDYLIWKERMRKLEKIQNEIALDFNNKDSFELYKWLKNRRLWCEKCNNQFYSNEGYVNHGCFK